MPNIHSMDPVDPENNTRIRPDLYIVTGKRQSLLDHRYLYRIHPDIEEIITDFSKELPYEVEVMDDFEGKGGSINLVEEFGDPHQGINAFIIEVNKKHIENEDGTHNDEAFKKVNGHLAIFLAKVKAETE